MILSQQFGNCRYCQQIHKADSPCAALCIHCHALHMLEDLVDGQCPRMTAFAQGEYYQMVPCQNCAVKGLPLQPEEVASNEAFAEKQKQLIPPECIECYGSGVLPLLVECCTTGCKQCGFLGLMPNPTVKRAHMEPIISNEDKKECAICLEGIRKGDSIFRMQCTHQFHYLCMAECLLTTHKRCPCCRHTDMFLTVDTDFMKTYRIMRGEPVQSTVPAHIDLNGEIVEGFEGEQSDDQELSDEEQSQEDAQIPQNEAAIDGAGEPAPLDDPALAAGTTIVFEVQSVEEMLKNLIGSCSLNVQYSESSQDDFACEGDVNDFGSNDQTAYQ